MLLLGGVAALCGSYTVNSAGLAHLWWLSATLCRLISSLLASESPSCVKESSENLLLNTGRFCLFMSKPCILSVVVVVVVD